MCDGDLALGPKLAVYDDILNKVCRQAYEKELVAHKPRKNRLHVPAHIWQLEHYADSKFGHYLALWVIMIKMKLRVLLRGWKKTC